MDVVEDSLEEKELKAALDIGALLVEARENKNLTGQDIAKQMNLTFSVISKIESNQFNQDIPLAFIRGYIRSYAQKVGLDVENLCVEFDRQTQQLTEPVQNIKVVSSFKHKRREINSSSSLFKFITFLIIAALLAFGGWELWKRVGSTEKNSERLLNEINLNPSKNENNTTSVLDNGDVSEESTASIPISAAPEQQIDDMAEFSQASAVAEQKSSDVDEIGETSLTPVTSTATTDDNITPVKIQITGQAASANFTFNADCWVKVTDANDEVLAVGIKRAGKYMPLEGMAPFTVILGQPSAVQIEFNGQAYDLSRFSDKETARFVLK